MKTCLCKVIITHQGQINFLSPTLYKSVQCNIHIFPVDSCSLQNDHSQTKLAEEVPVEGADDKEHQD